MMLKALAFVAEVLCLGVTLYLSMWLMILGAVALGIDP